MSEILNLNTSLTFLFPPSLRGKKRERKTLQSINTSEEPDEAAAE